MFTSEHKEKKPRLNYFNSLSNLPMFEQGLVSGKVFYNTTYKEDYLQKEKFMDSGRKFQDNNKRNPAYSTYNNEGGYNIKELSERLDKKYNESGNFDSGSENKFLMESFKGSHSISSNKSALNDVLSETKYSFSGTGHDIFKKPTIPAYTKRDNFFQTNAERNIAYVTTAEGQLMPFLPNKEKKGNQIISES